MEEKILISDLGRMIGKKPHTIRQWERDRVLPYSLMSYRDVNGYRYWSEEQAEGIINWLSKTDRRPGKGLKFYKQEKSNVGE